jgi:hypothetical protein
MTWQSLAAVQANVDRMVAYSPRGRYARVKEYLNTLSPVSLVDHTRLQPASLAHLDHERRLAPEESKELQAMLEADWKADRASRQQVLGDDFNDYYQEPHAILVPPPCNGHESTERMLALFVHYIGPRKEGYKYKPGVEKKEPQGWGRGLFRQLVISIAVRTPSDGHVELFVVVSVNKAKTNGSRFYTDLRLTGAGARMDAVYDWRHSARDDDTCSAFSQVGCKFKQVSTLCRSA